MSETNFSETIGVAGCGAMGLPMAKALLAAGFDVYGFDIRPVHEFGDFAPRMIADPTIFAARCTTVFSVVRDIGQTLDLCFDQQGIFDQPNHPTRLIVSSTVSPRFLPQLAARLPAAVELLDAPMSGAPFAARNATLTFMVGGPKPSIEALRPLFDAMGQSIHHLGGLGAGMTVKVINNFVAASSVVAVRHALDAAQSLGVDQGDVLRVMAQSSGGTWFGDNFTKIDWADEPYDPANTIGILEKDVNSFKDAVSGIDDINVELEEHVVNALKQLK